jgi:LysR family transcriptional regulator for metE and metH
VDAIVRAGTVTKAADQLFVTQPAVSHALKEMESKLGVKLFRREGRRMTPTPEGERLLETAHLVLDELARVEHDLGRYKSGYKGIIHIATGCYTCYHWLPRIMAEFADAFPDVDLQIVPEVTSQPVEALKDGRLDLAIIETEEEDPQLEVELLFEDELLVVMCTDHPLALKSYVTAQDFADQTLLVHTNNTEGVFYERVLGPAGVEPERVFALQLTEALIESVRSGLGIAVMPEWVVAPHVQAGRLRTVQLTRPGLWRTWSLVTMRGKTSVPVKELKRLLARDALGAAHACAV